MSESKEVVSELCGRVYFFAHTVGVEEPEKVEIPRDGSWETSQV